tara:strand:- start:774 stop:911 length:138 start_codon:yes stop_codon:yes gene_type:complete
MSLTIKPKVGGYFLQEYKTLERKYQKLIGKRRKQKEKTTKRIGDK